MFRKNEQHLQMPLLSGLNELPEKLKQQLEHSWAGTFYQEIFVRIDEELYAPLYADEPSRPNIPVNVLVGLEMMKDGNGWSDQEMHEHFSYNIQVRYALGIRNLDEGHFELRTVYNFRQRLSRHMQETGENLIERTFEQVTDEQIAAYAIKTQQQRMDSTQISSNIREMSRLQLLVEVLQRVHRELSEEDQAAWADEFEPYLKGSSGQYLYQLKGRGAHQPHLVAIGGLMQQLVTDLADDYGHTPVYQVLERVFTEHFREEENNVQPKAGTELSADSLQSPDDLLASYRKKGKEGYIGYVANATETCHPDNKFQLIVKMQTEPNTTEDADMLAAAVPDLIERTDLEQMNTDGAYGSPDVDDLLAKHGIELYQTAIRGRRPNPDKFNLVDCQWELAEDGTPIAAITPQGERVEVEPGLVPDRYILRFGQSQAPDPVPPSAPDTTPDAATAPEPPSTTPSAAANPDPEPPAATSTTATDPEPPATTSAIAADPEPEPPATASATTSDTEPSPDTASPAEKPDPPPVMYFSKQELTLALRRRRSAQLRAADHNPRAAVEATMGALKRPFGNDKLPVRGHFRVTTMMLGSAAMVNLRRIWRYQAEKRKEAAKQMKQASSQSPFFQFFSRQIAAFVRHPRSVAGFNLLHP